MATETLNFEIPTQKKDIRKIRSESVSYLPCKIGYDGPAPVHLYFQPEPVNENNVPISSLSVVQAQGHSVVNDSKNSREDQQQYYSASLRGRQITGKVLSFDQQVVGIVLSDGKTNKLNSSSNSSDIGLELEEKQSITLESAFDSMFVWNRDLSRHDNDFVCRAVEEYLPLQSSIHGLVDSDDE